MRWACRHWRPLFDRFRARADEIAPGLGACHRHRARRISSATGRVDLETGVIHADLFPDNVFFLGNKLSGLIDFYFACNDALAYDMAVCLNAWCFEPDHSFNITKGRALLKGYTATCARLPSGERTALPMLARGAALRFLLTRAYDWINTPADALVRRKDPLEYLRRLRFHQAVRTAARVRARGSRMSERRRRPIVDLYGRRVLGQSGPWRLGRDPDRRARIARSCRAARRRRPTTAWS